MSAYAIAEHRQPSRTRERQAWEPGAEGASITGIHPGRAAVGPSVLDALLADLAERVAVAVAAQLRPAQTSAFAEWLDSREAAEYLGLHRDTLRKLAAERAIQAHQEGPGCKLFFRRSDLDEWRKSGGRAIQLSAVLADAA
jgi:excisionase family DNA binding protein